MSVLENFKNIPRLPYGGRQGSNVFFFSSNLQRSPWRKKKRGACRPLGGDRVPILTTGHHSPPFPLSFEPKNSEKKRGVGRRKAAELCRIAYY